MGENATFARVPLICSFCGQSDEVVHLFAGGILGGSRCICDECVARAEEMLVTPPVFAAPDEPDAASSGPLVEIVEAQRDCSFCQKKRTQVQRMLGGAQGSVVCNECIDFFREFIAEHASRT